MKLTNRQLDTLAAEIAGKINTRYEKAKVALKKAAEGKILTKKEEKGFKLIEQGLKELQESNLQVISGTSYGRGQNDFKRLATIKNDFINDDKEQELDITLKNAGYVKVTPAKIEDELVLASIDSDSVATLVQNLAKKLGLKLSEIQ